MDSQHSRASTLPWLWVFEMLTSSNQVDVSLLLDFLKEIPDVSDDNCRKARELVSLRILEYLYTQKANAHSLSSKSCPKIGVDPSELCEYVLLRILREASVPDLKAARAEMLKWDMQPFIAHKKSLLTNCSLFKLKDAILRGCHPSLVSLRERSGLLVGDQPENIALNSDGDLNRIASRLEGSNVNTQFSSDNVQLSSPAVENGGYLSRGSLSAKRKRTSPVENARENHCKDLILWEGRKNVGIKYNRNENEKTAAAATRSASLSLLCTHRRDSSAITDSEDLNLLAGTSKTNKQHGKRNRCISRKRICIGGTERDSYNECTLPRDLPCKMQTLHHGAGVPNEKFDEEHQQDRENGVAEGLHERKKANVEMDKLDQDIQRNNRNVDKAEVDISSDSDCYNEEISDIAAKKHVFFSSQCTSGNLVTDWTEQNLCIQCKNGGNLLVCCIKSCPLVIHESCLGLDASFNKKGKFYCPFCVYLRAISKYKKIKEKANYFIKKTKENASLARNDLSAFCSGTRKGTQKQPNGSYKIKKNHLAQNNGLHENNELDNIDLAKKVNMSKSKKKMEYHQAGPSVLVSGDSPPFREKDVGSTHEISYTLSKGKEERKRASKVSQPLRVHGDHHMATPIHISLGEKVISQVPDRTSGPIETRSRNGVSCPPEKSLIRARECSHSIGSTDAVESSEDEWIHSYPVTPQLRRKRVPWKSAEEEKLKEGVEALYDPQDGSFPWSKILQFGAGIFDKSRTSVDLKDKWRNLCRITRQSNPFYE